MTKNGKYVWAAVALLGASSMVYAAIDSPARQPVAFYSGHLHDHDGTHGAPSHSGGTDRFGCHNGRVPYHCN